MKHLFYLIAFPLFALLTACNAGTSNGSDSAGESYDGTTFNADVISFDAQTNTTELEIRNGLDQAVREIKGRIICLDAEGKVMETATGRQISSPFQKVQNPHIIDAKTKSSMSLSNQLDPRTSGVRVEISEVKTVDGTAHPVTP